MKLHLSPSLSKACTAIAAVTSVACVALTGCGFGAASSTSNSGVLPAVQGKVMGGDTPIIGASVILWETDPANSGYGVATSGSTTGAQQLATATTSAGGAFTFTAGSYTCTPGEFAYITATGGSVNGSPLASGGLANTNYIQMAALGSCSHFDNTTDESKIVINLNEISTVAAAYTLGSFMTINDATPGSQLVYIGAPAKNNATTGTCTGTGASMACTAAGLSHAFANYANLVDSVHYDGTTPTGLAWTVTPTNTLGSVPQALINSLADIVAACVNSGGGVAGDAATQCGYLFADAQPTGGTAPTETLAALVDVAKYPQHNVGTGTCTGQAGPLFCLIPGQPAFTPALSASPHDWTLAITYSGMTPSGSSPYNASTATAWGIPLYLTLDANDNVYVAASNNGTDASSSTAGNVFAMASNGAGIWATTPSTSNCLPSFLTTDTNGNVFTTIAVSGTSGISPCVDNTLGYSTSTGALTYTIYPTSNMAVAGATLCTPASQSCGLSTPFGIGADRNNNLWQARHASCTSGNCFVEFPYTSGTGYGPNANGQTTATMEYGTQVLTDAQGNIYEGIYQETNAVISVVPNTNTTGTRASAPTYTATTGNFATTDGATMAYGLVALDAAGNVYTAVASGVLEYTPVYTGGVMTGLGSPTTISNASFTASKPFPGEFDGGGRLWTPSYTSSGQYWFWDISASSSGIQTEDLVPCSAPNGASACSGTLSSQYPKVIQVDSAGALWAADAGASSTSSTAFYVQQILGVGAPTWPQISYGVFETKPQ